MFLGPSGRIATVRRLVPGVKSPAERGLPPRIYVPILVVVGIVFLAVMAYLLAIGFRVTGSPFGAGVTTPVPTQGPRSTK
jgi:hypothetical protein